MAPCEYSLQSQTHGQRFAEHFTLFFDIQVSAVADQFDQVRGGIAVGEPGDGLSSMAR